MNYQIFKKNGEDFELVFESEDKDEMLVKLAFYRVDGGEYRAEMNFGSMAMTLGV